MSLKILPRMLPNKGVVLNKPEEMLLHNFSPHSRNMEFYDELLRGRLGLEKFDTEQLSGPILHVDQYWHFDYTWWLLVCTSKDIYAYDFSELRWDIITPVYTTGTIEVKTGELNKVYGSGTSWSANLKAGDFIKIGSGAIHTGSTWYEIQTVDSDTLLTLASDAVITAPGASYVARQCFTNVVSGANWDYWDSITFQDAVKGETWVAVNGKDGPIYWTGTGQVAYLTGLATGFTAAKYVNTYKNRLMFAWTVEGGQNQPQRERWSDVANCESWQDEDFHDFIDEDTWIMGIINFNDYHIVMKEYEAYIGRHVGGTYIFDFEKSTTCIGCKAMKSVISRKDAVYYFGRDNIFHKWNLLRDEEITRPILAETIDFDPNLEQYIYGWDSVARHQIRWHCPRTGASYNNYTVVYDYEQDVLQVWEYQSEQACCSIGEYLMIEDLYVDDSVWGELYVDEEDGYWDSRRFLQNAPITVYGGYDGYVRNADQSYQDDGNDYTRTFRSIRDNNGMPDQYSRLHKQELWLEAENEGDEIAVKIRRNDQETWDVATKTVSLFENGKDITKPKILWDKEGYNFQIQIDATNHFSLLGWLNHVYPKRKRKH